MILEKPCHKCNGTQGKLSPAVFSDQSQHIKKTCASCGAFLGWQKQNENSFKDELLYLVKDLSLATESEFAVMKFRAVEIMKKAPHA